MEGDSDRWRRVSQVTLVRCQGMLGVVHLLAFGALELEAAFLHAREGRGLGLDGCRRGRGSLDGVGHTGGLRVGCWVSVQHMVGKFFPVCYGR